MSESTTAILAGTLLLITAGHTYDECPLLMARAVHDFDLPTLRAKWAAGLKRSKYYRDIEFARWLLEQGHVRQEPGVTLWLDNWRGEENAAKDEVRSMKSATEEWW